MLIFNCTKAAAEFFTITRKGKKTSPLSPTPKIGLMEENVLHNDQRWHWMIHATKVKGKNVLLAMDADTRFNMVFWGIRKGGVEAFLEQFHQRLAMHIFGLSNIGGLDDDLVAYSGGLDH